MTDALLYHPGQGQLYMLGMDIGTGGCKVSAVAADGRFIDSVSVPHATHTPHPGWAEQDPADWIAGITGATRQLLSKASIPPANVVGIALSTAAHIAVLLDEQDRPVRRAIMWNDQRTEREVHSLEAQCGAEIFALTLQKVSTTWTLPHLAWIRDHEPGAWSRKRRILISKDYVVRWLTGRIATDYGCALSTQLFDATRRAWSDRLCGLVGLDSGELPEALPPGEVVGTLKSEAAEVLGLRAGTPVVNGALDSAAETYGAAVTRPGDCLIRLATAGGIHLVLDAPRPNPRLITYYHLIEPLWYCQAGTNSCASAVRWAIDNFSAGSGMTYEEWDSLTMSVDAGSEGLLFHPYLSGERCPHWDPRLKASFIGATLRHNTAHFARAVYEGTAFSIRDALTVLDAMEIPYGDFTVVGGGTASRAWLQILSEVLGRELHVALGADSSYGAALYGLASLGYFESSADAAAHAANHPETVTPEEKPVSLYNSMFSTYQEIHARLAPLYAGDYPTIPDA